MINENKVYHICRIELNPKACKLVLTLGIEVVVNLPILKTSSLFGLL
jgi:hypothetical protein